EIGACESRSALCHPAEPLCAPAEQSSRLPVAPRSPAPRQPPLRLLRQGRLDERPCGSALAWGAHQPGEPRRLLPGRQEPQGQPHPARALLEARLPAPGAPARAAVDARNRQARREVAAVPRVLVRRLTQRASSRIGGGIVPDELECCPDSDRIRITM